MSKTNTRKLHGGDTVKAFSPDERTRFFEQARASGLRDEVLFGLTYFLGLRVGETVTLKRDSVKGNRIEVQGLKGGKLGIYFLPEGFQARLESYLKGIPGEWLFPGLRKDKHLSRIGAQFQFYSLRDRAGLDKKFSVHCLRHTRAMDLIRAGDNPVDVQSWLRHRSLNSTLCYFRVGQNEEFKKKVANRDQNFLGGGQNV